MINIEERVTKAREYFKAGYNCSQSVVLAYADVYRLELAQAAALSSSFGGGMGRLREVCGAVSGMLLLNGLANPASDPTDREAKKRNYEAVQNLAAAFREEHGSIVCRELLALPKAVEQPPIPEERTEKYYANRPCVECVESGARIFGEMLNRQ